MFIITRFNISDRQRHAIAQVLGRAVLDDTDEARALIRDFLQRQGEQTLEALTLPLVARGDVRSATTVRV
jgi:hypothetical protein